MWQLVVVAVAATVVAAMTGAATAMVAAVAAAERQRRPQGRIVGVAALHLSGPPAGGGVGMRDVKKSGEIFFTSSWFWFTLCTAARKLPSQS